MAGTSSDSDYVCEEEESSTDEVVEKDEDVEKEIPEWIQSFLQKSFHVACQEHAIFERSDLNKYCVTCDAAACQLCIAEKMHNKHDLLTVYKNANRAVVLVEQMKMYIPCSQVQRYKCNGKPALSLIPTPYHGLTSRLTENETCKVCKRRLHEPDNYSLCSIACMVEHEKAEKEAKEQPTTTARRHRRKGIPHRAPFY